MKKSFYFISLLFIIVTVILSSCATSKIPSEIIENVIENDTYKMISINDNQEYLITKISYPEFESYPPLNKIIKNTVENNWISFKNYTKAEWYELNNLNIKNDAGKLPPFEYFVTSEISYSKNYISVLLNTYNFNGGAHGNTTLISYNFNKVTGQFDNIITATGMTYNQLSEICRSQLYKMLIDNNKSLTSPTEIAEMKEMINEGAFPQPGNFEIFTLSKNIINVYFEPYSVAPYSYGIQKIQIK